MSVDPQTTKRQVIDYTSYNGWGHALHGWTMAEIEPKRLTKKQEEKDKKEKARYLSVMVHSMKYPHEGDILRYEAERGIIEADIVGIKPCYNPPDMFTLEFRVVP